MKTLTLLGILSLLVVFLVGCSPSNADEEPVVCVVGVGGFGDGNGSNLPTTKRVKYSGNLNAMEEGIRALDQTIRDTGCTDLAGHSQGAAIVHVWLSRHPNAGMRAVLYADPKMANTGESARLFVLGGHPIAGTDANFGTNTVVSLCFQKDVICNRDNGTPFFGWYGYLFTGAHMAYDFEPRHYLGMSGQVRWW